MSWPSDTLREVRLLTSTQEAAENVMANKHALVEVDKRRQSVREATRTLEMREKSDERVTLLNGPIMFRLPKQETISLLKKDLLELDIESNRLRSQLKEDVSLLHELEMKDPIRGSDLQALLKSEMDAVGQVLGRSSKV